MLKQLLILAVNVLLVQVSFSLPDDPAYGYHGEERDALFALRDSLNSPYLRKNWNGLMCYMDRPPKWPGILCQKGRVTGIVLEDMGLNGTIRADAFVNLTQLYVLSLKNNSISGPLMDFSSNHGLRFIDLSHNMFYGQIHQSLESLSNLTSLQLNENQLAGPLLEFSQSSLRSFNVSYNGLRGPIPNTSVLQSFGEDSYYGNPELCGPPTPTLCSSIYNDTTPSPPSGTDEKKSKKLNFTTIFIIVDAALLLLVLLIIFFFCRRRSSRNRTEKTISVREDQTTESLRTLPTPEPQLKAKLTSLDDNLIFDLNDLLKASAEGLGAGNFGHTYKAILQDGPAVVVKRLRDLKPLTVEEFEKQMRFIADLQHPNLLPLTAFCSSRDEKLMIHRHISSGNLFNRIQGGRRTKERIPFRWNSRLAVARGVARGVEYLHLNTRSPQATVPHGNLKTSNILLDSNENPLLTDYGLTALISLPISSQRMIAYKSPEYQSNRRIGLKSDVWSFGIVLMELLTGKLSIHTAAEGEGGVDLCSWVHRAVREEWTAEIFDSEMRGAAQKVMLRALKLAMSCCDKAPEKRPEIGEVVRELESLKAAAMADGAAEENDDDDDVSGFTDESYSTTASGVDMSFDKN